MPEGNNEGGRQEVPKPRKTGGRWALVTKPEIPPQSTLGEWLVTLLEIQPDAMKEPCAPMPAKYCKGQASCEIQLIEEERKKWLEAEFRDESVQDALEGGIDSELNRELALVGGKLSARLEEESTSPYFSHLWVCNESLEEPRIVKKHFGCRIEGPRTRADMKLGKQTPPGEERAKSWTHLTKETHDTIKFDTDSARYKCFERAVHFIEGLDGHREDESEDLLVRSLLKDALACGIPLADIQGFWRQHKSSDMDTLRPALDDLKKKIPAFAHPRKEVAFRDRLVACMHETSLFTVEVEIIDHKRTITSHSATVIALSFIRPEWLLRSHYFNVNLDSSARVMHLSMTRGALFAMVRHELAELKYVDEALEKRISRIRAMLRSNNDPSVEISRWHRTLGSRLMRWKTIFHVTETLWEFGSLHYGCPEYDSLVELLNDQVERLWDIWTNDGRLPHGSLKQYFLLVQKGTMGQIPDAAVLQIRASDEHSRPQTWS